MVGKGSVGVDGPQHAVRLGVQQRQQDLPVRLGHSHLRRNAIVHPVSQLIRRDLLLQGCKVAEIRPNRAALCA